MYVFFNESGDLCFDFSMTETSRNFVISLLACHNKQA